MNDLSTVIGIWTGAPKPTQDGMRLIAARGMLATRDALRRTFPAGLVHDPVTEIVMTLYVAAATSGPVRYEAACAASGVTRSVARRWLMELEKQGMIATTTGAGGDWVSLTDKGVCFATRAIDAVLERQATLLD